MKTDEPPNLHIVCPHCQAQLTVDTQTGDILFSRAQEKRDVDSFESALALEQERQQRHTSLFDEVFEKERKRKELLEKKFQEARQSGEFDDKKPPENPFSFE